MNQILYSRIEGEGQPLLILHGYLGMSDNWKTLSTKYVQEGYQVHAIDLRNHGRSFHTEAFTHELMVEDLISYCDYHKLNEVNVIGHSMGGKLGMFLAVMCPEIIDKLIIADISVREYKPHHQEILKALNAVDFTKHTDRKTIEDVISERVNEPGVVQFLMKNVYRVTSEQLGFRMNLKSLTENYNNMVVAVPALSVYRKPVLFLRGERSDYIKENDFDDIYRIFPKACIVTISNAGHWLHADNPTDFFNESVAFLKNKNF